MTTVSHTTPQPLRMGILGCSDIARRRFIPALLHSRVDLAAIASRNREKAAGFLPGKRYESLTYEEMISGNTVDVIYISLPNHLHEEWAIKSLEAGKHVICEKPLGLTPASVERMIGCAAAQGLLLYENLMFLHHPQHSAVKHLLETGAVGKICSLRSVFGFPSLPPDDVKMNPEMGGGALHDLSRYILGTADYFLKGNLSLFTGVARERNGLTLSLHGTAITTDDEVFSFSACFGQQYESFYEIIGETGKITVDRAYTTPPEKSSRIRVIRRDKDDSFVVAPADHFQLMIDHVCDLITDSGDFAPTHAQAGRLAALAERLEKGCTRLVI